MGAVDRASDPLLIRSALSPVYMGCVCRATLYGCARNSAHSSTGCRSRHGLWEWISLELCSAQPLQLNVAALYLCEVEMLLISV